MDSMQIYRGMDIGTATPSAEERAEVRHHLLDIVDPGEEFTVSEFKASCMTVLADLDERGARGVLVGGTGLHVRAVVDDLEIPGRFDEVRVDLEAEPDTAALHDRLRGLDPVAAERMEPTNRRRVVRALEVCVGSGRPFSSFGPGMNAYPASPFTQVGVHLPRAVVDRRIAERYEQQLAEGFVDEVRTLASLPGGLSRTARQALGYRQVLDHLEGRGRSLTTLRAGAGSRRPSTPLLWRPDASPAGRSAGSGEIRGSPGWAPRRTPWRSSTRCSQALTGGDSNRV